MENWEEFIQNSILDLSNVESYEFVILINKVHERLSREITQFLISNGLIKCLSGFRATYLGGSGDILLDLKDIINIHDSPQMNGMFTD